MALDVSHQEMVQFRDKDGHFYQTVVQHLKIRPVDRTPIPQPSKGASEQVRDFDFIGHVHLFKAG